MVIDKIIERERIKETVATETAWIGKTDGDMDGKYIGESEQTIFSRFFSMCVTQLNTLMARYGVVYEETEGAKISLQMPANFPTSATASLISLAEEYMTAYIVNRWSEMVRDDRVQVYQQKTASVANELLMLLNKRIKNKR